MRINDIVLVKCLKLSGRRRCGNPRRMALFNSGLAFTMLLSFHLFSSHVALDNKAKSYIKLEAHVVGVIIFTVSEWRSEPIHVFELPFIAKIT